MVSIPYRYGVVIVQYGAEIVSMWYCICIVPIKDQNFGMT